MTQVEVRSDFSLSTNNSLTTHECCEDSAGNSWSLCLTSWQAGFTVRARSAQQTRVLIGEPATRGRHPSVTSQIKDAAAKLLEVHCSAAETIDVLCRVMTRQLGGSQLPGPSLTLIDLYDSGRADIACHAAPPVLHVGTGATENAARCAGAGGVETETVLVELGDYLIALSPTSVQTLSAVGLSGIPELVRTISGPCRLRDELLDSVDGRDRHRPAPPMAIVRRRDRGAESSLGTAS